MELQIPEINLILTEIKELKYQIQNNSKNELNQEWYNDEQCWKLKGGMALSTYRSNRFYQIKGGIPDSYVGGRKVWSKASLIEWIPLSDNELPDYHTKYRTGAKKRD